MSPLPNRRPTETMTIEHLGENYHVSVGFYPDTMTVAEVWARGPKPGSDAWALLQDVAHSMSKEIQAGATPEKIAGRAMRGANGEPLSVYGILADAMRRATVFSPHRAAHHTMGDS